MLVTCAALLAVPAHGQPSRNDAGERVRAHVEFLADDLLEGRGAGARGYDIAANYVAAMLRAYGFEPAGDRGTFLQSVPLRSSELADASFTLHPDGGPPVALGLPTDALVFPNAASPTLDVTAPLVYAGFGITAPEHNYDDYAGLDAHGRIVVVIMDAPPQFPSTVRAVYSDAAEKLRNAARHGAVGVVSLLPPEMTERLPWQEIAAGNSRPFMTWLDPQGRPAGHVDDLRGAALLSPAAVETLFAHSPVPLAEIYADAKNGSPRPFAFRTSARIVTNSRHGRATSANVVGLLKGAGGALADSYVVSMAHLDHVGIGAAIEGDAIYNGAYDNALGSAVLLEVARAFGEAKLRPRRSVLVVFVTAEEHGMVGSDYFAAHPPVEGPLVAGVNVDMPFLMQPLADVVAMGAEHSSLGAVVARVAADFGVRVAPDPMPEEHIFIRSDQYSLVKQGIPAVMLVPGIGTEESRAKAMDFLGTHYHRPSDDLSRPIDYGAAARFARLNYLIARNIANDRVRPTWKADDVFGKRFGRR